MTLQKRSNRLQNQRLNKEKTGIGDWSGTYIHMENGAKFHLDGGLMEVKALTDFDPFPTDLDPSPGFEMILAMPNENNYKG